MANLPLTLALGHYDHTRDVTDGPVRVEGVDLRVLALPIEEIFYRFFFYREWEISEISMGKYIGMRADGDHSVIAMPVYISRMFRHSMFYVREGSAVKRPEDLKGKRIGIPEWGQTAGIYGRGYLTDYVGVPLKDMEWVQAGVNQPGRVEKIKLYLPDGVRYTAMPDRSLNELLLAGELDCVMSARPPAGFGKGIARLMPEYQKLEEQYFRDTNIYPIMHSLCMQTKVLDAHPWVAMNLYKAFNEAKDRSVQRLSEVTASHAPLAWVNEYTNSMRRIFGDDPYPYGIGKTANGGSQGERMNYQTLDAFLKFGHDQGVCAKRLAPEELYPKSVMGQFKV